MDIIVTDVKDSPANTYLSVRYGDFRRQVPFRKGEKFTFPAAPEKSYTVDVFRKVGSKQISLAGISALGGNLASKDLHIPSLDIHGLPVTVSLMATMAQEKVQEETPCMKKQAAQRVKTYLEKHGLQNVLQDMFARLLERLPADPLSFLINYLEQQREDHEEGVVQRDFSQEPGLGHEPLPGFHDSASVLPSLSLHHSLAADVLRTDAQLFQNLRHRKTNLGVPLARCIKPGMDCPGHELVKVAGAYAGDEQCYELFRDFFDPIISELHNGYPVDAKHPTDTNPAKITNAVIDDTGQYAVFATLETRRNLSGFRLPSCCSFEERREVERAVTRVLVSFTEELKGGYYPLRTSESYLPRIGGMSLHQEDQMRRACILFAEPDSRLRLSAGFGRHWPDARGIYVNEAQSFFLWCNEEDHVRVCARQHNIDVKAMWTSVSKATRQLESGIAQEGYKFMRSNHLGYLSACPSKLGTALRISVSLKIPLLAASVDLSSVCRSLHLQSSQEVGSVTYGSVWNISNCDCLGASEVDIVNCVVEGARAIVNMERRLEKGVPIYDIIPGMGDEPYPGFPVEGCPLRLPDLTGHHNLVAVTFKERPELYRKLRSLTTSIHGITLAPCIKPGMEEQVCQDPTFSGLVAGDEECFTTFADLFDPVIQKLHSNWTGIAAHPHDSDLSKLSAATIDPRGSCAVAVRVELRRNLSGLKLAPCCELHERREAERVLVRSLMDVEPSWSANSYMPLRWSQSYLPKPNGMTAEEQSKLLDDGLAFPEPCLAWRLSMGIGRHWPDARGAFLGNRRDCFAWVNEEDHLLLASTGADLKGAFTRAKRAIDALDVQVRKRGYSFMRTERHGYLTVSPANLGNGLRCVVSLMLPQLGRHAHFGSLCQKLALSASWEAGTWTLSNSSSLGISEVDLVNRVIDGCAILVSLEHKLSQKQSILQDLKGCGVLSD